jgi:hypothetical protein
MIQLTFGLLAMAMLTPPQIANPQATQPAEPVQFVTPFEVSDDHEKLAGKTISMIGNVDDEFSSRAFTIDDDLPWNTAADILVIAPEMKKDFSKVAYVRIVGRVAPFNDAEVQKFINATPAIAEKLRDFKGRAIVLATTVTGPSGETLTVNGKD